MFGLSMYSSCRYRRFPSASSPVGMMRVTTSVTSTS